MNCDSNRWPLRQKNFIFQRNFLSIKYKRKWDETLLHYWIFLHNNKQPLKWRMLRSRLYTKVHKSDFPNPKNLLAAGFLLESHKLKLEEQKLWSQRGLELQKEAYSSPLSQSIHTSLWSRNSSDLLRDHLQHGKTNTRFLTMSLRNGHTLFRRSQSTCIMVVTFGVKLEAFPWALGEDPMCYICAYFRCSMCSQDFLKGTRTISKLYTSENRVILLRIESDYWTWHSINVPPDWTKSSTITTCLPSASPSLIRTIRLSPILTLLQTIWMTKEIIG